MNDLMIDIETMGNGSNAAMIQIAAVRFDRETGEMGQEFVRNINLNESTDAGFSTDKSTRDWWAQQDQEVLKNIQSNTTPLEEVMTGFSLQYGTSTNIWSHATFDFPIVQNYLKHFGLKQMPFRGARDIRTLIDLSGFDLGGLDWSENTHDALDDCKFQIDYCVKAMTLIRETW